MGDVAKEVGERLAFYRGEIERLTIITNMQYAELAGYEEHQKELFKRIAELEGAIATHVKQFPPYALHTLDLRNAALKGDT